MFAVAAETGSLNEIRTEVGPRKTPPSNRGGVVSGRTWSVAAAETTEPSLLVTVAVKVAPSSVMAAGP